MTTNADVWAKAVEKASSDPEFRNQLLTNTHQTLIGLGGKPEHGVTYSIVVNTPDHRYLVLPHAASTQPVTLTKPPGLTDGF